MRLVASDMDGTFLDGQGTFDQGRLSALLDKFDQTGVTFVAASGRSLLALEKLFAKEKDRVIFVAENGGLVKQGQKVLFEASLSQSDCQQIMDMLAASPYSQGQDFLFSGLKGSYHLLGASQSYRQHMPHYYENFQEVASLDQIDDTILKMSANFDPDHILEAEDWFNARMDKVRAVTTGFESVDIILKDLNKATGLEILCQELGISASQVLAFGDNLNDLEMLAFAGTAIAPANARQQVKDICDQVIGPCQESSVLAYLEGMVEA